MVNLEKGKEAAVLEGHLAAREVIIRGERVEGWGRRCCCRWSGREATPRQRGRGACCLGLGAWLQGIQRGEEGEVGL